MGAVLSGGEQKYKLALQVGGELIEVFVWLRAAELEHGDDARALGFQPVRHFAQRGAGGNLVGAEDDGILARQGIQALQKVHDALGGVLAEDEPALDPAANADEVCTPQLILPRRGDGECLAAMAVLL